jgi:hypothetical protein
MPFYLGLTGLGLSIYLFIQKSKAQKSKRQKGKV